MASSLFHWQKVRGENVYTAKPWGGSVYTLRGVKDSGWIAYVGEHLLQTTSSLASAKRAAEEHYHGPPKKNLAAWPGRLAALELAMRLRTIPRYDQQSAALIRLALDYVPSTDHLWTRPPPMPNTPGAASNSDIVVALRHVGRGHEADVATGRARPRDFDPVALARAGIGTQQNPMPPILVDLRDLLQRARRALSNHQGSTAAKLAQDALTKARSFRGDAKLKAKVAEMVAAAQFVLEKAKAAPRPNPGLKLRVPTRVVRSPAAHGYASIGKQLGATLVRDLAYWSAGHGATAKLWPVLKAARQPHRLPAKDVPGTFRAVEVVYENFIRPHLHPGAEGFVRGELRHYFNLGNPGAVHSRRTKATPRANPSSRVAAIKAAVPKGYAVREGTGSQRGCVVVYRPAQFDNKEWCRVSRDLRRRFPDVDFGYTLAPEDFCRYWLERGP